MKRKYQLLQVVLLLFSQVCLFAQSDKQITIPEKESNSLRIMTYNVRNGLDTNRKPQYEKISEKIRRVSPDIVAVQEVDSATRRSQGVDLLKILGENCMMYRTFAPIYRMDGGAHGLGVLSKEKPLAHRFYALSGEKERKGLLLVEFKDYVVLCTQFSKDEEEQKASVPIIFEVIQGIKKPVFLAGDMNCDFLSPSQNMIQSKFKILNDYNKETIPVENEPNIPYGCIDFVYGYSEGYKYAVLGKQVLPDWDFDHYPLYVDVRISTSVEKIFKTQPYLQRPIGDEITVCWETNVPTFSWVEYGKDGKLDQKKLLYTDGQMLCNNTRHHFRLNGLEAGETYSYRVCSQEIIYYGAYSKEFGYTAKSDVHTFTLPEKDQTDFTALIFNDLHNQYRTMDLFADLIKKQNIEYDFVVYNGDCMDAPKNESTAIQILNALNKLADASDKPYFFLRGNHEIRGAYSIEMRKYFDYIDGTTYGSFNWGDTRFVTLDCGEDKADSTWVYYGLNDFNQFRIDQAEFLKKELMSSSFKQAKRHILIHHIPIYAARPDSYNPCFDFWAPLLEKAPFDISINAHRHHFAYYPKGKVGNNFPVIVGGGYRLDDAYMMILQKQGNKLTFRMLSTDGQEKLKLDL